MIVVIDDTKSFPIPGPVEYARTLAAGFSLLEEHEVIDQLWLDHDLGGDETIRPLVLQLAENAFNGNIKSIGCIIICSLNVVGANWIASTLMKYYQIKWCQSPEQLRMLVGDKEATWF